MGMLLILLLLLFLLTSMQGKKNSSAQPKKRRVCGANLACPFAPSAVHQVRGLRIQTIEKRREGMILFGFLQAELSMYQGLRVTKARTETVLFIVPVPTDV